jgi:hypothetical protein
MMVEEKSIFEKLKNIFSLNISNIKDPRKQRSDLTYLFKDIVFGAFSMFYLQNGSWLKFQANMQTLTGKNNARTLFGIEKIPVDNHIRKILDKVSPESFKQTYKDILQECQNLGIIKQFVFMKEYLLVAIDGTIYHSSQNIKCDCCQTKKDSKTGIITHFHTAITPVILHPKLKKVIALFQEFISNDDGKKKQDCEINASKRWFDNFNLFNLFSKKYKFIILGDDLYSRVPMINKILEKGYSFILVCKKTSHKILYEQIQTYKLAKSCKTLTISKIHNGKKQIWTYNFINELLLTGSNTDNVEVNWCELIITDLKGKQLHHFSFVTNLKITAQNVEEIIEAGRSKWKIENENNNILKTKGYNLKHNYGHGDKYLSQNLCSLNILAFLFHTIQDFCDENYGKLRLELRTRKDFFYAINFQTTMQTFKNFDKMIEFILLSRQGKQRYYNTGIYFA